MKWVISWLIELIVKPPKVQIQSLESSVVISSASELVSTQLQFKI